MSMRRYAQDDVVDAVVIGTGAGGAPLAARLAAAGLSIVALGYICAQSNHFPAVRFQKAFGIVETLGLTCDDADLPATFCKTLGNGETDTGAGAGHDD